MLKWGGDRNPALIWPGCSLFYYSSRPRSHHQSLVVDYGLPGLFHRLYLSRYKAAEVIRYPMRYPKPAEKIARLETSRLGWSLSVGYFLCSYKNRPVSGRWLLGATSGTAGRT